MDPALICRLSDPAQPHGLCLRSASDPPLSICYSCKGKHVDFKGKYFYCDTCKLEFHWVCHLLPPTIKHHSHPSHPLSLVLPPTFDISWLPRSLVDVAADNDDDSDDGDGDDDADGDDADDDDDDNDDDGDGVDGDDANGDDDDDDADDDDDNDGDGDADDDSDDDDADGDDADGDDANGDDDDSDGDDARVDDHFVSLIQSLVDATAYNGDAAADDADDDDDVAADDDDDNDDDSDGDGDGDGDGDDGNHKCKCCQSGLEKIYYHCSTCNFNLNWRCSLQRPDTTISHSKKFQRDQIFLICRLSDPAQPHKLCRRFIYEKRFSVCFSCKGEHMENSEYYLYCDTCDLEFHRSCHLLPPKIKHPFHPSHPLTRILHPTIDISLLSRCRISELITFANAVIQLLCGGTANAAAAADDVSVSNGNLKCKCCRRCLQKAYYQCSICNFNLNLECSVQRPDLKISHFKSHKHPFTLFPLRLSSPCDACGLSLDDTKDFVYACLPCSHMIHKSCIYLPRVIKITRHPHRLSFTTSLVSGDLFCGVCREKVDSNYEQYSCQTGCHYAVHLRCATRKDVWDGKDLERVPEEPEEDIKPFVRIDEETIQHFSHEHYLNLKEKKNINEKAKFCEACTLPIRISQRFYGCMQCDFVLDEACASLPRKLYHPLHKHPLTLHPFPIGVGGRSWIGIYRVEVKGIFKCDGCKLDGCGFQYKCGEKDCEFHLDVRCAALPDPIIHGCHPQDHPLYFTLTKGNCMGCGSDKCSSYFVECIKCKSFLGLGCATLPSVVQYKHDSHPLTLCCGEEDTPSGQYWCEICEEILDSKKWFYTCETCRITLHVRCLLGNDIYMKPNHIMKLNGYEVEIALNDGNSRVVCYECHHRCKKAFVLKMLDTDRSCCTLTCMETYVCSFILRRRI